MSSDRNLLDLIEEQKFEVCQENGQRRFGPPRDWDGPRPPRGCEVFIARIQRDLNEAHLLPIFEEVGKVYEFRLMLDFNELNRGFAFVTYTNQEDARRAVSLLNNRRLASSAKALVVTLSMDNCRLFVSGLPKDSTNESVLAAFIHVPDDVPQAVSVLTFLSRDRESVNAYITYESHRDAALARRAIHVSGAESFGYDRETRVDWAIPKAEHSEEDLINVKALFVRGFPRLADDSRTHRMIKQAFNRFGVFGVEKVVLKHQFAFVFFYTHDDAVKAYQAVEAGHPALHPLGHNLMVDWQNPPHFNYRSKHRRHSVRNSFQAHTPQEASLSASLIDGRHSELSSSTYPMSTYSSSPEAPTNHAMPAMHIPHQNIPTWYPVAHFQPIVPINTLHYFM